MFYKFYVSYESESESELAKCSFRIWSELFLIRHTDLEHMSVYLILKF